MTYTDPGCAYCPPTVRACRQGESEARGPGFCPSKVDEAAVEAAWEQYADPEVRRIARASALVESEGCANTTMTLPMHSVVQMYIDVLASPAQKARFYPEVVERGRLCGSWGSEPDRRGGASAHGG